MPCSCAVKRPVVSPAPSNSSPNAAVAAKLYYEQDYTMREIGDMPGSPVARMPAARGSTSSGLRACAAEERARRDRHQRPPARATGTTFDAQDGPQSHSPRR